MLRPARVIRTDTRFPYTTLFQSGTHERAKACRGVSLKSTMQLLLDAIGRGFDGGTLEFVAGDDIWMLGHGEPRARVQLRDPGVLREILLRPSLKFGETYMEHGWEPADGEDRKSTRLNSSH